DVCDADTPLGKQTDDWYTHTSGIWQTVWLEGRPAAYLSSLRMTPDLAQGAASFVLGVTAAAELNGSACRLAVESVDGAFPPVEQIVEVRDGRAAAELDVRVAEPRPWSPEDPHLYECVLRLEVVEDGGAEPDVIRTYLGL